MSKGSTYFFTAWSAVMFALAVFALFMSGCASVPKAEAPVVSAFIFTDRCDDSFVAAAFVRSDGSIVEADDMAQAEALNAGVKKRANGRIVPVYAGECAQKL